MATWSKLFSNFAWKNRPDTSTPLGQTLLNRLNNAINGIDDRVVTLNAEKASTDDLNGSIVNVSLNSSTGIFTFTRFDGTTFTINTALEEVVTNFVYDYATQSLVLTLADGTTQNVDLSALITQYEFTSSATILFTVGTDGKVTANIKPNSITDQMLQTNYLADITTQANTALSASQSALESQSLAEQHAENAEASADRAEEAANRAESVVGFTVDTELSTESTNPIANKAVAEEFGNYFPKTGGTVDGNIDLHGRIVISTDKAEAVRNYLRNANRSIMFFLAEDGAFNVFDNTNSKFLMQSSAGGTNTFNGTLTTKPTGTYTGNGDATERVIETGGIGTMLYLRATAYSAIVLESGAIVLKSDGTIQYIPYQQTTFKNGKLTLKTDGVLNTNGTVFTYTVH